MRKVGRGTPLEEATKGSYEYTLRQIRNAFYRQHPDTENEIYWVEECFTDHIVVNSDRLKPDEFYFVTYTREGGSFVFAPREQWEIVELTYQPQTLEERLRANSGRRLIEVNMDGVTLAEAQSGQGPRVIHADGATADAINGNGRRYRTAVLVEAVADARHHLRESLSQGRAILLGEEEHPAHKNTKRPHLTETIVAWQDIWFDAKSGVVKLAGNMIENSKGRDAIVTMDAGVLPGVSLRGYGESEFINENGRAIEEVLWLRLTGFDLVMNPSFDNAGVTALESKADEQGDVTMPPEDEKEEGKGQMKGKGKPVQESQDVPSADTLMTDHPGVVDEVLRRVDLKNKLEAEAKAAKEKELREAAEKINRDREEAMRKALGIDPEADLETAVVEASRRRAELEGKEQAAQVTAYIEAQTKGLVAYPDWLRASLQTAIVKAEPKTVEEAKTEMVKQREIFDKILAEMKLRQKGHGLDVLGPVLESETGVPEFARGAYEVAEGLRNAGHGRRWNLHKKDQLLPSEVFTIKILERFDTQYRTQLEEESRRFAEAETTSDLNLPYSVTRAILEQAYPSLITANVFDIGVMSNSPDRIYYESQFVGETGYSNTVTGSNNVNAAAAGTWYNLPSGHKRLLFSSVSMQPSGGGTPFTLGVDYLLDFEEGRYLILSTGTMSTSTNYDLDYVYYGVRKGEGVAIERAKAQLAYVTLEAFADRLAVQVTSEAVLFGRSQIGWDAAMSSINLLIKELRLLIERNLLNKAWNVTLLTTSNIAGTWNSSSDTIQALVSHILAAKTKIENRHYEVTSIIMSKTRGNPVSLWDGFTAAGQRPGFRLDSAPGLLGYIAEIPVFTSSEFPDGIVLVNNRELVQHRIYRPMEIKGPYPVYDSGKLVDNEEYFAREYNGTITPLTGKGSVVRII